MTAYPYNRQRGIMPGADLALRVLPAALSVLYFHAFLILLAPGTAAGRLRESLKPLERLADASRFWRLLGRKKPSSATGGFG